MSSHPDLAGASGTIEASRNATCSDRSPSRSGFAWSPDVGCGCHQQPGQRLDEGAASSRSISSGSPRAAFHRRRGHQVHRDCRDDLDGGNLGDVALWGCVHDPQHRTGPVVRIRLIAAIADHDPDTVGRAALDVGKDSSVRAIWPEPAKRTDSNWPTPPVMLSTRLWKAYAAVRRAPTCAYPMTRPAWSRSSTARPRRSAAVPKAHVAGRDVIVKVNPAQGMGRR